MKIKILFVAILLSMSTAIASSKLFKYIRNNNIDAIREYVIKNFDAIEEINEDGDSPLIYTVKQGKPYIAKALIDLGANVNFISENGETALSAAVKSEKPYYINLFIIHGAKIKMKNKKGQTLLMYAANMNQDTLAAHLLLEAGADINQKDVSGQTPIVYAAIGQNYSLFLYLMDQGANPEDKSFKGVKAKDLINIKNEPASSETKNKKTPKPKFIAYDYPPVLNRGKNSLSNLIKTNSVLKNSQLKGKGTYQVFVETDGTVKHVVGLAPMQLAAADKAITEILYKLSFKPAEINNKPVAVWISLPITIK